MDCLNQFGDISGLRINANKSNVFMAGINSTDMAEIKTIKGATLSYAGRSELIRSVIQGYNVSSCPFCLSRSESETRLLLCAEISSGGRKAASPKKPLVAWKDVCKPKSESGLGFIDLNAWNMALMSKSLWNLQAKKDSLWVKWGNVNVKASYEFFRPKAMRVHWTKVVWHRSMQPKHSFILWLSLKERLLTRDKLMEQIEDTSCVLCGNPKESVSHLFFHCTIVRQIWAEIKEWLGFSRALTTLKATAKWIIKEGKGFRSAGSSQEAGILHPQSIVSGKLEMLKFSKAKLAGTQTLSGTSSCRFSEAFTRLSQIYGIYDQADMLSVCTWTRVRLNTVFFY
ncbi:hypothetical protein Acr_21g0010250 [Actinidia rufa]|uniref:Reverse transcriptase zinc-binding domain-containing protein n=1 Tax=Actinidia rufa TaxID=165716 RepID=A0A7J0GHZ6_9ERIC|nr:hypothetical protein Acr_21g0010250 [Actinidia rufa]